MPDPSKPDRWRSLLESFGLAAPASQTQPELSSAPSAEPVAAEPSASVPVENVADVPEVVSQQRVASTLPPPPAKPKPKPTTTAPPGKRSSWSQLAGQLGLEVPPEPVPLPEPLAAMLAAQPLQQAPVTPQAPPALTGFSPPPSHPVAPPPPAPVQPAPAAAAAKSVWDEDTSEFPAPGPANLQEDFRGRRRGRGRGRDRVRRDEAPAAESAPRVSSEAPRAPRPPRDVERRDFEKRDLERRDVERRDLEKREIDKRDIDKRDFDYVDDDEEVATGAVIEYGIDDAPLAGSDAPTPSDDSSEGRKRRRRRRGRGRRGRGGAEAPVSDAIPSPGRAPLEDEELDEVLPQRGFSDRDEPAPVRGESRGDFARRDFIDEDAEPVDDGSDTELPIAGEARARDEEPAREGVRRRRRRRRRGGRDRETTGAAPPREVRPATSRSIDDEDDDDDLDDVSYAGRSPRRGRSESPEPRRAPSGRGESGRGEPVRSEAGRSEVSRDRDDLDHDDHDDGDEHGEELSLHKKIPTWEDAVGSIVDGNIAARSSRPEHGGRGRRGGGRGGR